MRKPPSQSVKTKDAPKKMKPTPNDNSTARSPSFFEHVYKAFYGLRTLKSQKSVVKWARIIKPLLTPPPPKISFIDEMLVFMHKYIEWIVNVVGDVNCSYRAVSALLGKGEYNHTLVHDQLIQELMTHKESYTRLYRKKEKFYKIYESLVPCLSGTEPGAKWMHFLNMGRLITCMYDRVCVNLTQYGFSETFSHCTLSHLKIQMIVLCVLGGFQNQVILVMFTWKLDAIYHLHHRSGWLIQQQKSRLSRTILWTGCKSSRNWATLKETQMHKSRRRYHP